MPKRKGAVRTSAARKASARSAGVGLPPRGSTAFFDSRRAIGLPPPRRARRPRPKPSRPPRAARREEESTTAVPRSDESALKMGRKPSTLGCLSVSIIYFSCSHEAVVVRHRASAGGVRPARSPSCRHGTAPLAACPRRHRAVVLVASGGHVCLPSRRSKPLSRHAFRAPGLLSRLCSPRRRPACTHDVVVCSISASRLAEGEHPPGAD